jgi:hypothetical protein
MGLDIPCRIAMTPAIKVVDTAPIPGVKIPNLPLDALTSTFFIFISRN